MFVFDKDGNEIFKTVLSETDIQATRVVRCADNSVKVLGMKVDALVSPPKINNYVMSVQQDSDDYKLLLQLSETALLCNTGGDTYDFYYSNDKGVRALDINGRKTENLLDWIECGISGEYVTASTVLSADKIVICAIKIGGFDPWNDTTAVKITSGGAAELYIFTPRERIDAEDNREVIRLAILGVNRFETEIAKFNSNSKDYKIIADVYDMGITMDGADFIPSTDAISRFNAALISKNPPDIICAPSAISLEDYIVKGALADLYPHLDDDSLLGGRSAIVPYILRLFEENGALYQIPANFFIQTIAGRTDALDGKTSWSIDEILALTNSLPSDIKPISNKTSAQMLEVLLYQELGSFIDWRVYEASFDSDEFVKILEYAGSFPLSASEFTSSGTLIREGKALADTCTIMDFYSHAGYKTVYGGDITYIGFPCQDGSGSALGANDVFSISASSQNKDAAWAFISYLLSAQTQTDSLLKTTSLRMFPVNNSVLETLAITATEKNIGIGANGIETELPKTTVFAGEFVPVYAMTQDEVDTVFALISSVTKVNI